MRKLTIVLILLISTTVFSQTGNRYTNKFKEADKVFNASELNIETFALSDKEMELIVIKTTNDKVIDLKPKWYKFKKIRKWKKIVNKPVN